MGVFYNIALSQRSCVCSKSRAEGGGERKQQVERLGDSLSSLLTHLGTTLVWSNVSVGSFYQIVLLGLQMHIGGQKSQDASAWHEEEEEAPTGVHLRAALEAPQPAGPGMSGPRKCCQLQRYQKEIRSTRTSSRFRDVKGCSGKSFWVPARNCLAPALVNTRDLRRSTCSVIQQANQGTGSNIWEQVSRSQV